MINRAPFTKIFNKGLYIISKELYTKRLSNGLDIISRKPFNKWSEMIRYKHGTVYQKV